jgi:hypothetical protein
LSADGVLPAETVRDQTLAIAGLLDRRIGGPGVFPPQPAGLWEELAYDTQQFTAQTYRTSDGGDRYRRSLYTFWKRAAPPPTLAAFDAPDREVCVAARPKSPSPQQALILMNEPQWIEAARQLAARVSQQADAQSPAPLARLFQEVLARPPSRDELRALERAFATERSAFARDPTAAAKLLGEPQAGDSAERPSAERQPGERLSAERLPESRKPAGLREAGLREVGRNTFDGNEADQAARADRAARADQAARADRAALVCVAHVLLSLEEAVTLP